MAVYSSRGERGSMYHIAICDDNPKFCCLLENYLEETACELHAHFDVEVFWNAEDFLNDKEKVFDLIFLDINLSGISGIELGNRIRSRFENSSTEIVFLSGDDKYAMQLFKIRPMDFLIKPVQKQDIFGVMKEYIALDAKKKRFLEYSMGKQVFRIDTAQILYFQSMGRKVCIRRTRGEDLFFYEKLSALTKRLEADMFWTIHKSYIVNLHYVTLFCPDCVVLTTGEKLPVSQSMRKEVNAKLISAFNRKGSANDL